MDRSILRAGLRAPVARLELVKNYCRGKSVLDVGCVQHDAAHASGEGWLHKSIVEVGASVIGVDYLANEVRKLAALGYRVVRGDVTKPLELEGPFNVIVVGNLIEHLSGFDGL